MRVVGRLLIFAWALGTCAAQKPPLFSFSQQFGPHPVGLRVVSQYDYSRTFRSATDPVGRPYVGERARPLQTLIWYPAETSSKPPMTVNDYTVLLASETNFAKPMLSAEQKLNWIDGMSLSLATPLHSVLDSAMSPGRFPVVIYAPSFNAPSWENADLCEYLASFGYVVIASPDMGAHTREMTQDLTGIGAQAQDISFLIGYAQTLSDTDMTEVAVGGFSWGGISNLFAAARDSRIDALFCLDGSLRYFPALVTDAGDVHPDQMTIPLLYFTQGEQTIEDLVGPRFKKLDAPSVLNEWTHGDRIMVDMFGMVHAEYSAMYQRNEDVWKSFPLLQKGDYSREDGVTSYFWMAKYTLEFLNAYLKHDGAAMAYLQRTPAENGVPKHLMTAKYRAAAGRAPSLEAFRRELGRQGFEHAAKVYAAFQQENPDFTISEVNLEMWAREIIESGHLPEAVQLLKWNAEINAKSAGALTALADAYQLNRQNDDAIDAYEKALGLSADNPLLKQAIEIQIRGLKGRASIEH